MNKTQPKLNHIPGNWAIRNYLDSLKFEIYIISDAIQNIMKTLILQTLEVIDEILRIYIIPRDF